MPATSVFLSSTCYDLGRERNAIERTLKLLGHTPILSNKNNIHYNPDKHTHDSCLEEVSKRSDILVGILHSRRGGLIYSEAFRKHINVDLLKSLSNYPEYFNETTIYSITQCEILKAIEIGIPYMIFVHQSVIDQRLLYENWVKGKKEAKVKVRKNTFSPEMVGIFNFIKYINNLDNGNAIYPYQSISSLRKQLIENLSYEFKARLDERLQQKERHLIKIIPENSNSFSRRILEKLKDSYKRQAGLHSIKSRIVFDKYGGCHYYLHNTIIPKTDYQVYHFTAQSDKNISKVEVLKFKNVTSVEEDQYIGFIDGKDIHLFLFHNCKKGRAFTIELEFKIKEYANKLIDEGKSVYIRRMSDENKKYKKLHQILVFPAKAFKNLQLVCYEKPEIKNCKEQLIGKIVRGNRQFELDFSNRNLVYKKDPILRIEMSCEVK